MTNQRSVMTEFRALEQKRQTEGLTAAEAARLGQLRELVGPETAAPRSGFDVNAAAARLRESLLPAGLRGRPESVPAPPPPDPEPQQSAAAVAVEVAWADAPFSPIQSAPVADPLFDPASLGREVKPQAWNPEAPGYDPNAPYDEEAWIAAGYDPSVTYDWSAYGYGPDGQPLPQGSPEPAPAQLEPALAETEAAPPMDAAPRPGAASGLPVWGDEAQAVDVEFTPGPASAIPLRGDTSRPVAASAGPAPIEPAEGEEGWVEVTEAQPELEPLRPFAPPTDPHSPAEPGLLEPGLLEPAPAEPAPVEAAAAPTGAAPWPEPDVPVIAATPEPAAQAAAPPFGEYDEAVGSTPLAPGLASQVEAAAPMVGASSDGETEADPGIQPHLPAPPGAPFGDYDEAGATASASDALVAMLPFDPAAASAIAPDSLPEGYEVTEPGSFEPPAATQAGAADQASLGPDSMYGGPEGDSLPGGPALDPGEVSAEWQPETALDQGFELASEGSFGHEDLQPLAPLWSAPVPAPVASSPERPPALDLGASFEAPSAEAELDAPPLVPALPIVAMSLEAMPLEAMPPEAMPPEPEPGDDLPTIEGEEILEEIPEGPDPTAAATAAWEPEPAVSYEPAPDESVPPEIAAAYAEPAVEAASFEPPPSVAASLFPPTVTAAAEIPVAATGPRSQPFPEAEAEPMEAEPLPPPPPTALIEGTHRVVLHTVDGQVRRGLLVDALLDAEFLTLHPAGAGAPDVLRTDAVKAIFFMLAAGEKAPPPEGKKVRVTFRDGRQVAGYSPDYQDGLVGFFMIPADTRTNTGRIWVYQGAVRQVAVS